MEFRPWPERFSNISIALNVGGLVPTNAPISIFLVFEGASEFATTVLSEFSLVNLYALIPAKKSRLMMNSSDMIFLSGLAIALIYIINVLIPDEAYWDWYKTLCSFSEGNPGRAPVLVQQRAPAVLA